MTPDLKRYTIEGAVLKLRHLRLKQFHEEMRLKKRMFREGRVPVLDIAPIVDWVYNWDKGSYQYMITMYGVEVEGDVWEYEGYLTDRLIRATTQTQFQRIVVNSGMQD